MPARKGPDPATRELAGEVAAVAQDLLGAAARLERLRRRACRLPEVLRVRELMIAGREAEAEAAAGGGAWGLAGSLNCDAPRLREMASRLRREARDTARRGQAAA